MVGATRRCSGITKGGKQCPVTPPEGRTFCVFHDPERQAEASEARRRGGYNRKAVTRARKLLAAGVKTMADVQEELLFAFVGVRDGDLDPRTALALASLARALKDVVVSADYETQIRELREEFSRVVSEQHADDAQTA